MYFHFSTLNCSVSSENPMKRCNDTAHTVTESAEQPQMLPKCLGLPLKRFLYILKAVWKNPFEELTRDYD